MSKSNPELDTSQPHVKPADVCMPARRERQQLTAYEQQAILLWLAIGYSRSDVAEVFGIDRTDVMSHRTRAKRVVAARWRGGFVEPKRALEWYEREAVLSWSAAGYWASAIAAGMGVPQKDVDQALRVGHVPRYVADKAPVWPRAMV